MRERSSNYKASGKTVEQGEEQELHKSFDSSHSSHSFTFFFGYALFRAASNHVRPGPTDSRRKSRPVQPSPTSPTKSDHWNRGALGSFAACRMPFGDTAGYQPALRGRGPGRLMELGLIKPSSARKSCPVQPNRHVQSRNFEDEDGCVRPTSICAARHEDEKGVFVCFPSGGVCCIK